MRRRAKIRADFPILSRTVRDGRPLVYLDSGATSQKSAPGARRRARVPTSSTTPPSTAARTSSPRRPPTRSSRPARASPRSSAPIPARSCSPRTPPKGSTSWRTRSATPRRSAGTRRRFAVGPGDEIVVTEMEHHANLMPWQELCRRTGATLRWYSVTDEGRLDLDSITLTERTKLVGVHAPVQRARHDPAGRRARRAGARGRRADAARRLPVGAAHAVDLGQLGVDFVAFSGPQDARADRGRRALRAGRAAGRDAAVPHRRLDDRDGEDGGLDVRAAAAAVRGRRADDVAGRRVGRRRRLPHRHRHGRGARARARSSPASRSRGWPPCRACASSARRTLRAGAGPSRSSSTASTPTTSARCSTTWASPCGWVTTARGRCTVASAWPPRPGRRSTSTPRPTRSTRCVGRVRRAREFFGVDALSAGGPRGVG